MALHYKLITVHIQSFSLWNRQLSLFILVAKLYHSSFYACRPIHIYFCWFSKKRNVYTYLHPLPCSLTGQNYMRDSRCYFSWIPVRMYSSYSSSHSGTNVILAAGICSLSAWSLKIHMSKKKLCKKKRLLSVLLHNTRSNYSQLCLLKSKSHKLNQNFWFRNKIMFLHESNTCVSWSIFHSPIRFDLTQSYLYCYCIVRVKVG